MKAVTPLPIQSDQNSRSKMVTINGYLTQFPVGNNYFSLSSEYTVLAAMEFPEALTSSADICIPVRSSNDAIVAQVNENYSTIANSPGQNYIEPYPYEVNLHYNMLLFEYSVAMLQWA